MEKKVKRSLLGLVRIGVCVAGAVTMLTASAKDTTLNVYNWSDYISQGHRSELRKANGHQGALRRVRQRRYAEGQIVHRPFGLMHYRGADQQLCRPADRSGYFCSAR